MADFIEEDNATNGLKPRCTGPVQRAPLTS
jgi:hypothetical protein